MFVVNAKGKQFWFFTFLGNIYVLIFQVVVIIELIVI